MKSVEWVNSIDGTSIAYSQSGKGPPLVLVHGAGAANPAAWPAFPLLTAHFRVIALNRRGRGGSGDGATYALEREFEDVAAVVDAAGEPVFVLGHSFGGLCALGAAGLTPNFRKLILYEPAIWRPGVPGLPEGLAGRLHALMDSGDREALLTVFYREIAGLTSEEIDQLRESPAWPERLASAHTLPREYLAEGEFSLQTEQYKDWQIPALILVGEDSPPELQTAMEYVHAVLPHSGLAILPGQGHLAMYTAPELFVREVRSFLNSDRAAPICIFP